MIRRNLATHVACLGASLFILGGCGTSQLSPQVPGSSSTVSHATGHDLLYVSDAGANVVDIYSYPGGTLLGKLSGFTNPTGLCTDPDRDVWVVDTTLSSLYEYPHGNNMRKASLKAQGAFDLLGCSVDPTTGDLAVAEIGTPSAHGGVWVFKNAQGTPKKYKTSALAYAYFCGYDNAGNLFVDGIGNGKFVLVELPSGSSTLKTITLDQSVGFPGEVQWDGKYVAIGDRAYQDQHESAIYQFTMSGSSGKIEGTTKLNGSCDVIQFGIASSSVIAPDACYNVVRFYKYPGGGTPTKQINGFQYPVAAVMSPKK
jgi:hypothetical protein